MGSTTTLRQVGGVREEAMAAEAAEDRGPASASSAAAVSRTATSPTAITPTSDAANGCADDARMARMKTLTCSMRVSRRNASMVMSRPDDRAKYTVAASRWTSSHSRTSTTIVRHHVPSTVSRLSRRTSAR